MIDGWTKIYVFIDFTRLTLNTLNFLVHQCYLRHGPISDKSQPAYLTYAQSTLEYTDQRRHDYTNARNNHHTAVSLSTTICHCQENHCHMILEEEEEEEGGTCRTLAPTLFLKAYDLGVRAEAVPGRAVVDGLEVRRHDVAHGQRGDDAFLRRDRFHRVAAGRPGLQHGFFPRPGLRRDRRQ